MKLWISFVRKRTESWGAIHTKERPIIYRLRKTTLVF
jgi:hypothetical protein